VGSEARAYRPDGAHSFFRDVIMAAEKMSPAGRDAEQRLERNNAEYADVVMHAAGLTQTATAGGEFVPPVWYVERYGGALRGGRPFLNGLRVEPLPAKMNSLNF